MKECDQTSTEEWKKVPGLEDIFLISSLGRIYSKRTSKVIKPTELKSGYLALCTKIGGRSGIAVSKRVHRLVAEAFMQVNSEGLEVNHKDGDKKNNSVDNLEWVTSSENMIHAYQTGLRTAKSGASHSSARFTIEEVEMIRKSDLSNSDLAAVFSVNRSTIYRCRNGMSY
ncbi:NUMOD4 motif-containing HNH endonuclease [Salmonella enterica]|uniref:NUMOD4 motif-containing HNH endonuclease n=1 Tax=Salmonella enterica TaxID=28901 RepID=UPI003D30EFBF